VLVIVGLLCSLASGSADVQASAELETCLMQRDSALTPGGKATPKDTQIAASAVTWAIGHNMSSPFFPLMGTECDQLSGIMVGGRDLGMASVLLCRFWPAQFGDFPIHHAKTVVDLFNGAADLWERIQALANGFPGGPFCWKAVGLRQLHSQIHMDSRMHMNATEAARSSDCDVEVLGKCYGPCPAGMSSTPLIGSFAPVCTSSCVQSDHQTPCGFGCASGIGACLQQWADQITAATRSVGVVASFMSGNFMINEVVDKVLRLVEFAIDVIFDLVKVAKRVWSEWPREHVELGLVIALVYFVFEHGQEFQLLNGMFGETLDLILDLVDGEFIWREVNLKFVSDTILKHGTSILGATFEFAQIFMFPQCKVVTNTNPHYDCDGDGSRDCGHWSYRKFRCNDNGGRCGYRFKFGDMLLDHSCRCKQ